MTLDKQGKEKIALLIGFMLILGVAVITFQHSPINEKSQDKNIAINSEEKFDYPVISTTELQRRLVAQEELKIIDLRSRDEFAHEHIAHSLNIPAEDLPASEISGEKTKSIILVGGNKTNYSAAIKALEGGGYAKTMVLSGGFASWKDGKNQTISSGDPNSFIDQAKITYTTPEKLKDLLDAGEDIYILDIRSTKNFTDGHLPGARNIPFHELEQREKELPLNIEIVIYGDSELQGFQAGVIAYDLNFFTAYVLQGNIKAWKEKGFEIVK